MNKKRDTIFIIGNGFDLYHDIKTSFAEDFMVYCQKNKSDELDSLIQLEVIEGNDVYKASDELFWKDFEKSLGEICFCNIRENYRDDYEGVKTFYSYANEVVETLTSIFIDWIDHIEINAQRKLSLDKDAFYINFNYTKTLEKTYDIPKNNILYIHVDDSKYIFGHGKTSLNKSILDDAHEGYIKMNILEFEARQIEDDCFIKLQKPVVSIIEKLRKNKKITARFKRAKQLVVLGHSIKEIDYPYFEYFFSLLGDKDIILSYYSDCEKSHFEKLFCSKNIKISLKKIDEIDDIKLKIYDN